MGDDLDDITKNLNEFSMCINNFKRKLDDSKGKINSNNIS
jgi:hypothetical protein